MKTGASIRETETGFDVIVEDAVKGSFGELGQALEAARPLLGAQVHEPHLKEAGAPVGQWRWLDAATLEPPDPAGYFDGTALAELVDSLNAGGMPVPIDGGGDGSAVHGTARDSSTPANGWGHAAVLVERTDGPHMFMWSELLPTVAPDVDRGRLAYGSVLAKTPLRSEEGAYRGCRLLGHALTNVPVIRDLAPSTAVRAELNATTRTRPTRSVMDPKSKQKPADVTKKADGEPAKPTEPKSDAPPPPAEDKDAVIAALRSELEAAKSQIEALTAEAAARADAAPSEEELKMAEAKKAEDAKKAAEAHVEKAIKAGVVAPSARAKWVDVVMKSGADTFDSLTKGMRARPARQVVGAESGKAIELDPDDVTVKSMRGAGISDAAISRALIERDRKQKEA